MSKGNLLVLLAHNDDEYFVSAAISRERAAGTGVYILYTTHGSAYGVPTGVREAESLAALASLGVSPTHIRHVGHECAVRDGTAHKHVRQLLSACHDAFPGVAFTRLLTMAWEGGHPDHDTTYLIAAELAREWHPGQGLWEFPLYTQVGAPPPFFRTMRSIPGRSGATSIRLLLSQRVSLFFLFRFYPSQWRSFLGLLPESAWRILVRGTQPLRLVNLETEPSRPHPGRLYYERRYGVTFETLMTAFTASRPGRRAEERPAMTEFPSVNVDDWAV
jgi:GlcNAc-PI de-N-acetylase